MKGKKKKFPQIYKEFSLHGSRIKNFIQKTPLDQLEYYWRQKVTGDPVTFWKGLVLEYVKKEKVDVGQLIEETL